MTLRKYAAPLRNSVVNEIDTDDVLSVLRPLWLSRPETASRLRGRIEHVLDAARAKGFRHGPNPALWRGNLDKLLPKRPKVSRGHHAAMPYEKVAKFIKQIRKLDTVGALAIEFTVLTAARTGEVLGATWDEFDVRLAVWTIPAKRMKSGRVHRVPLSDRVVSIIRQLEKMRSGEFVFGRKAGYASNTREFCAA